MDRNSIIERIETNKDLRSMPGVFSEILKESSSEDFSAGRLADLILKDPSLTGKILRLANSSFYGRAMEIKTVHHAVSMLGATTVKCLALSTAIFQPEYFAANSGLNAEDFFSHILSVASAAESIAKAVGYKCPEEALISGLLHDIGIVFFLHHFPDEYGTTLKKQEAGLSLVNAEREIFEIDHCEVGFRLATAWHLPEKIISAIANHHNDDPASNDNVLGNITRLAILLTFSRFSDGEQELENRVVEIGQISKRLGIEQDKIGRIARELISRVVNMAQTVGVEIGEPERLLSLANQEIWKSYLAIENLFKERQHLNNKLLAQERQKGAFEARNTALSTLSHYVNNAAAVISGQFQILLMLQRQDQMDRLMERLPVSTETVDQAINRIVAVMRVMREISPTDEVKYFKMSKAMNIDDRIAECMEKMAEEPAVVLPMED